MVSALPHPPKGGGRWKKESTRNIVNDLLMIFEVLLLYIHNSITETRVKIAAIQVVIFPDSWRMYKDKITALY